MQASLAPISYTGATNLQKGTTILASSGSNHLPATTALTLGSAGNFATLQLGDAAGPTDASVSSVAISPAGSVLNNAIVGGNSLPTPSTLTVSPSVDFTMPIAVGGTSTDAVQNNLKLIKTGTATMLMNLTNYYTGGTDIGAFNKPDGGTLVLDDKATLGNINFTPSNLNVYGGTLETRILLTAPEVNNLNLGGGAAGSAAQLNLNFDLTVHADIKYDGTNNPNPAVISGSAGLILSPPSLSGTTITVGSSAAGSGGALAPDLTISSAILGSSDIHKAGPGTLRLVENAFTTWQAGFFVDAGTLILDGTSDTSGVLANNVAITVGLSSSGAKLDFGASRGEQTIFQTLVVNSNSTLTFNLGVSGTATSDNLLLTNNNGLTLGTGLKININALPGFGQDRYILIDESTSLGGSDPGNPFTLGTKPGGFSYTLGHTFIADNYLLFLDVGAPLPAFYWKGTVDNKWSAATNGNWVDINGVVISGVPGTSNDVTFSSASPSNSATVVNVNMGAKILTINDAAAISIKGVSGTVLSIGDQLIINAPVVSVSLGSATAGEELFIGVVNNFQSWTNNGSGTLTVFNQVFSEGKGGTQTITFNGSGNVDIKGNIINGGLGGAIQLVQSSPTGTLTLENPGNTYTGGTLISTGTVEFKTGALPALGIGLPGTLPPGRVEFTGDGTLRWLPGNTNDVSDRLMIHDTKVATLDVGGDPFATVSFASPILTSNLDGTPTTGILRKIGSTTLKMANITGGGYTGGTEIGAGVLEFGSGALPPSTRNITFIGTSTLRWSAGNTDDVSDQLRMADGVNATLDTNGNDVTFNSSAILNGTTSLLGTLTKAGAGTLTFTQFVTAGTGYSGGTNIAAGTLQFASGALPSTGSIRFTGSSTLQWATGNADDISSRLNILTGVTGTLDTNGNDVTFRQSIGSANSGVQISSPGTLTKDGAGTLSLTGANPNFTGATDIAGGTLEFAADALPGPGAVTFTGSTTLRWISGNTNDISSRLNIQAGVTATLDTNGSDVAFLSPIQGSGAPSGSLTKTGSGTLTLIAASPNFKGAATVDTGTMEVSGSLSGATAVNVSAGATLKLNGTGTNLFSNAVPVSMGAGSSVNPATLAANINNSIQTMGEFTLAGNSVIDFAGSVATAQLKLANSAAASWTGSLSIYNWDGSLSGGGARPVVFRLGSQRSHGRAVVRDHFLFRRWPEFPRYGQVRFRRRSGPGAGAGGSRGAVQRRGVPAGIAASPCGEVAVRAPQ